MDNNISEVEYCKGIGLQNLPVCKMKSIDDPHDLAIFLMSWGQNVEKLSLVEWGMIASEFKNLHNDIDQLHDKIELLQKKLKSVMEGDHENANLSPKPEFHGW